MTPKERNWVFIKNSNFLIAKSLQPDVIFQKLKYLRFPRLGWINKGIWKSEFIPVLICTLKTKKLTLLLLLKRVKVEIFQSTCNLPLQQREKKTFYSNNKIICLECKHELVSMTEVDNWKTFEKYANSIYKGFKELSLWHKLKFYNPYIFTTWQRKPLIFITLNIWSSKVHSLIYQWSKTMGKDKGIRKS